MRNSVFILIAAITTIIKTYAAEPVVNVGGQPTLDKLEFFEESEELFAAKLLEYYDMAIALKTQIKILGYEAKTRLFSPSYEELSDQDVETLLKYYKIAKSLEKEVKALAEDFSKEQIEILRRNLVAERRKFDSLSLREKEEFLAAEYNEYFKDRVDGCIKDNIYKNFVIDSLKFDCLKQMEDQREVLGDYYDNYYSNTTPVLSISASGNAFFMGNDNIIPKVAIGTELLLNCNPIFKYGKYIDIWMSYVLPIFETKSVNPVDPSNKFTEKWNSDIYSVGLNGNVPEMITLNNLQIGFKIGLGYFWGNGRMYNIGLKDAVHAGQLLKFELNFGKKSVFAPYDVFIAYSTYFHSSNLTLQTPTDLIDLGKPNINKLSLGLRFGLIRASAID